MKKINYLLGVLFIAALLIVLPASAEDKTIITGDISPTFSMVMQQDVTTTIPLLIGENTADGATITVKSNTPYVIKARDEFLGGKHAGSEGRMEGFIAGTPGTFNNVFLTNPLQVTYNGGTFVPMTNADQVIWSAPNEEKTSTLKYKQVVTATDPVLTGGYHYLIALMITGGTV